jgi:hypothetical protein
MGKKLLLLFLIVFSTFYCNAQLLSTGYTPSFRKGKIKSFLEDIKAHTNIAVSYSDAIINIKKKVVLTGDEHTVGAVLHKIFETFPITLKESDGRILVVPATEETIPAAQKEMTISGFVKDSSTKEVLIGASIYIPETGTGAMANNFGFYSLTLPDGKYTMVVSYVSYKSKKILVLTGGQKDILLENDAQIEEVHIVEKVPTSEDHTNLAQKDITFYTSLLGDNDIIKSLQHLPGVQSAADGTTNLIVRGGDPGQNLNLLDGVPLYYTDHFYGISSIFNTDALKTVDFYSGSFPSRYGGRLSSIIDVNTKDGNMEHWGGVGKIGLLNSSLSIEGPIIKNKASIIVTARRSWLDLLWRPFTNDVGVNFYDINAKVNYEVNASNRIFLSVYNGRDMFRIKNGDGMDMRAFWGNTFVAFKWNTVLNPKVFLNSTATYSIYSFEQQDVQYAETPDSSGNLTSYKYKGLSKVTERTIKSQLYWYFNTKHKIETGIKYSNADFSPSTVTFADGTSGVIGDATPAHKFLSNEAVLYIEDEWKPTSKLKIRAGLHLANWFNEDFHYSSPQPRLYISYTPSGHISFYGSATKMAQFLHLLSNNTSGFPTDFWLPSTASIKPETSLLGNIGLRVKDNNGFWFSIEGYYKKLQNLITYRGGNNIFENPSQWEDRLTQGKGWSYGSEFMISKSTEKYKLTLAYTLSWSFRQFDKLNYGEAFPYRYDRRHNLHIDGRYTIRKGIVFSAGWTYMSGEAITLPDQAYPDFDNNLLHNYVNYGYTFNYTAWNNYRLPAIHRLDLAINFIKKRGERFERTFTVGIYNAYGRSNLVATSLEQDDQGAFQLKGYTIGRFIPTICYRLQF